MRETRGYGSPAAFRRALTDTLKAKAETSRWTLPQLQRQMAYDRLLERLYLVDEGWVVKGATALLAREIGVRATIDIDVYREAARDVAEADLRAAATKDIGDCARCDAGRGTARLPGVSARRSRRRQGCGDVRTLRREGCAVDPLQGPCGHRRHRHQHLRRCGIATLDDALGTVTPFLDPLLDGRAAGAWDPEHRRWT